MKWGHVENSLGILRQLASLYTTLVVFLFTPRKKVWGALMEFGRTWGETSRIYICSICFYFLCDNTSVMPLLGEQRPLRLFFGRAVRKTRREPGINFPNSPKGRSKDVGDASRAHSNIQAINWMRAIGLERFLAGLSKSSGRTQVFERASLKEWFPVQTFLFVKLCLILRTHPLPCFPLPFSGLNGTKPVAALNPFLLLFELNAYVRASVYASRKSSLSTWLEPAAFWFEPGHCMPSLKVQSSPHQEVDGNWMNELALK